MEGDVLRIALMQPAAQQKLLLYAQIAGIHFGGAHQKSMRIAGFLGAAASGIQRVHIHAVHAWRRIFF